MNKNIELAVNEMERYRKKHIKIGHYHGERKRGKMVCKNPIFGEMMTLDELYAVLRKCWSRETSNNPKTFAIWCPAIGQCAVTARIVCDMFGGQIISSGGHYWNRIDGVMVDLTSEQRRGLENLNEYTLSGTRIVPRTNCCKSTKAKARYELLKRNIVEFLNQNENDYQYDESRPKFNLKTIFEILRS